MKQYILDTIIEQKNAEVTALSEEVYHPKEEFETRSFYEALLNPNRDLAVIAEVKKASPSKGVLVDKFNPVTIATSYEKIKVDAISVLTDEHFFQGKNQFLTEIKKQTSLPILRKDFLIHEKQIYEAKGIGADAILLIAAILTESQIKEFMMISEELQLDVLMEVHDEEELAMVLSTVKPKIIGVNNRNLKTFETNLSTSKRLASLIPKDTLFVSESGIRTREDIELLRESHVNGLLVGEAFMVEENKEQLLDGWFKEVNPCETTP